MGVANVLSRTVDVSIAQETIIPCVLVLWNIRVSIEMYPLLSTSIKWDVLWCGKRM